MEISDFCPNTGLITLIVLCVFFVGYSLGWWLHKVYQKGKDSEKPDGGMN